MSSILFLTFSGVVLVRIFPIFHLLLFVCLFVAVVVVFHAKEGKNGEMLRFLDLEIHIVTTKNSRQTRHLQPCVFKRAQSRYSELF